MITVLGVPLTLVQLLGLIPVVLSIVREAGAVIDELQDKGVLPDDAKRQALTFFVTALGAAIAVRLGIPRPRRMTFEEEMEWMDRAKGIV